MDKVRFISQAIYNKKGVNLLALDVRGVSAFTDYFMIAEGTSCRHVQALAHAVMESVSCKPLHTEGMESGEWVVLDYGEVVVHLFTPELRNRYRIEEVWKTGALVDMSYLYPNATTQGVE